MKRFSLILICAVLLSCQLLGQANAGFFGFGSEDRGKSGLDFSRGYDLNTVGTFSGRVTESPRLAENGQYLIEMESGSETVNLSVGPENFWGKKGIPVKVDDEITAKGSRAQGQDGKTYLLTQKLVNRSNGKQVEIRSDRGEPAWSGRSAGAAQMRGGIGFQGGGFMRGGGMMGGGGMMRR
ncbi:hypothetical protein [Citrifermentans bremense]|uniref:hypothetical protein n=1 Tax=Citrifermentans bremense TaxID=60035 RepID=UPI0006881691|nr:hypothetical protein [Citrifermentans bremense]